MYIPSNLFLHAFNSIELAIEWHNMPTYVSMYVCTMYVCMQACMHVCLYWKFAIWPWPIYSHHISVIELDIRSRGLYYVRVPQAQGRCFGKGLVIAVEESVVLQECTSTHKLAIYTHTYYIHTCIYLCRPTLLPASAWINGAKILLWMQKAFVLRHAHTSFPAS